MDFSNYKQLLENRAATPRKMGANSLLQEVAIQMAEWVREPVGKWIGATRRYGPGQTKALLERMQELSAKFPAEDKYRSGKYVWRIMYPKN